MKNFLQSSGLLVMFILVALNNFNNSSVIAQPSCIVTGPVSVTTNTIAVYTTTILNQNWEVFSYDGAAAIIVRLDDDSLEVNTVPTTGRYTVYVLANPSKEELCSLNVTVDAALPVELSSFVSSVKGRNVTLSWTTTAEQNNSGFDVERSIVNGQWSMVNYGVCAGNSMSSNN